MISNQKDIISFYSDGRENDRAAESRAASLEFHYTKKLLSEYINSESNVIELGCASGYYGMFFADKCATYTGVDLSPDNIEIFKNKIIAENKTNIYASVGDATCLLDFADESFDVALCLGPMYHLPQEERLKVFDECRRIAKRGAILAFAYINGIGVYAGACTDEKFRHIYPNARANKYVFEYKTDDVRPGVFLYTSPEEMEHDARQKNLEVIKNCGLDFFFASSAINAMSDEQFGYYMELSDKMSDSPSCTGLANHALMICKKSISAEAAYE